MSVQGFHTRGFYLHAGWKYAYPFAVRSWSRSDYAGMFRLLRLLRIDRVMLWPMLEAVPAPLSTPDAAALAAFHDVIADAQSAGLETWIVISPCLSSRPEISAFPLSERHLYPFALTCRVDDPLQFAAYCAHLEALLAQVNNADAYVFIDGDPGSYAGAKPEDYLRLLQAARAIIDRVGARPRSQKVVPWIWCGWGADWGGLGPWKPDLPALVKPVLELLKRQLLAEPWELLPGRSSREGKANGRINFELADTAGLIERSSLMTYEIVEYEPGPPAVALQFEDIRRVLRQEAPYATAARGIFGSCQQPVTALPNLFYFARCAADPSCMDWPDSRVLEELARFLGGPHDLLAPAWGCLHLSADRLPADLPQRLRAARLEGEAADCLPGGSRRYLEILARLVSARLAVLRAIEQTPLCARDAAIALNGAVSSLARWWQTHEYIYSGEGRAGFGWEYTHPLLWRPLAEWVNQLGLDGQEVVPIAAELLAEEGLLSILRAEMLFSELFSPA